MDDGHHSECDDDDGQKFFHEGIVARFYVDVTESFEKVKNLSEGGGAAPAGRLAVKGSTSFERRPNVA
jgi:hypothetical protein